MTDTGRAARVRLERRLETARHGADLLDRKRRILRDELDRLVLQRRRTEEEWSSRAAEAARWLGRATSLDGSERVEAAAAGGRAAARVEWGGVMGVRYPRDTACELPPSARQGGSAALAQVVSAHRAALVAAVARAAAQRAEDLVAAELAATRTRQRAVEHRWIPRLEARLAEVGRRLAELEMEEGTRLRWVADVGQASGDGAGGPGAGGPGGSGSSARGGGTG